LNERSFRLFTVKLKTIGAMKNGIR